jgi:hypothetical protein
VGLKALATCWCNCCITRLHWNPSLLDRGRPTRDRSCRIQIVATGFSPPLQTLWRRQSRDCRVSPQVRQIRDSRVRDSSGALEVC